MSSPEPRLSAAQYLRMAEELEAMAATIARNPQINHHFAERLALIASQMREDCAHLPPASGCPGDL